MRRIKSADRREKCILVRTSKSVCPENLNARKRFYIPFVSTRIGELPRHKKTNERRIRHAEKDLYCRLYCGRQTTLEVLEFQRLSFQFNEWLAKLVVVVSVICARPLGLSCLCREKSLFSSGIIVCTRTPIVDCLKMTLIPKICSNRR